MSSKENKQRADNVREYLTGIGRDITSSQAYEVVARSLGYRNKHTLAAASTDAVVTERKSTSSTPVGAVGMNLKIFEIGERPFSGREVIERSCDIDVVVPVDMESIQDGDIDELNDTVSELITGSICGLVGIEYKVYPHFYDGHHVAMRVTAHVDDPADQLNLSEDAMALLSYKTQKSELAMALQQGGQLTFTLHMDEPQRVDIDFVDGDLGKALARANALVSDDGMVDDEWHNLRNQTALSVSPVDPNYQDYFLNISYQELVYAEYRDGQWLVDIYTDNGRVRYGFKTV